VPGDPLTRVIAARRAALACLLGVWAGCSGSGLTGALGADSGAAFTLGPEPSAVADVVTSGDAPSAPGEEVVDADVLEQDGFGAPVPAPDGFPTSDSGDCSEGEPCPLDLSDPCFEGRCNALGTCVAVAVIGCCTSDDHCSGLIPTDACDLRRCVEHECVLVSRPGCCSTEAACQDDEPCTDDVCVDGPGGQCTSCPTTCSCPDAEPRSVAYFDGQTLLEEGFGVDDSQPDAVSWRLSTRRAISAPGAAWLGDVTCPTYYSGTLGPDCQPTSTQGADAGPVRAQLVGPAVVLTPRPGGYVASFWVWSDVEPMGSGGADERDVLTLFVHDVLTGDSWPVTSTLWVGKSTLGSWRQMAVDLGPWTGSTVSLRFLFDTHDGQDNHHEGVYLDDVVISPRCATGCCEVDADCPSPSGLDACTTHRCLSMAAGARGTCLPAPATPGSPCTACANDAACEDASPCTEDLCGGDGLCTHVPFCCLEVSAYATSFEEGLLGWYVADDQPNDGVTWVASDMSASDGSMAAWLGDPGTGTYAGQGAVRASLYTPLLTVPADDSGLGEAAVRFALALSTEWDGQVYDNPAHLDRLSLKVSAATLTQEVWSSDDIGGTTLGEWAEVEVSLAPWAGQSVQLSFTFDTVDDASNDYAGPRIDDVRIGHVCP
jgi:hypothetical protein